jgi:teichoic acid transport system ATP-binding protein
MIDDPRPATSIYIDDVHIDYEVFVDRRAGLRERLLTKNATGRQTISAIRGVTISIESGESVGIMGLNGAGKSTLLTAIAGLLPVTRGRILVADEPRLMGVGISLIGKLTGRQNIRLGCLALGMSKEETDDALDRLSEYAELGEAIDRPFQTYSSGMKARVQFTIATAAAPKILLIDEGLSVGDKNFRAKSRTKVEELIDNAGSFVLVNHSLSELQQFCSRGIWLTDGQVSMDGPIEEVIKAYSASA